MAKTADWGPSEFPKPPGQDQYAALQPSVQGYLKLYGVRGYG